MTAGPEPGGVMLPHRNRWRFGRTARGEPLISLRRRPVPGRSALLAAQPTAIEIGLGTTALIVVDLQNDFCAPDGWLASVGVDVSVLAPAVELVAGLVPAARAAGLPVIWLNWGNRPDQANLPPGVARVYDPDGTGRGIGFPLRPEAGGVLTKGSWGAALVDGLTPAPADIGVDKYRMSGFWDTPLDTILRNQRVDTLIFAGVNSDQCVYATLIDAACIGYDVVMLGDACATTSPPYCHEATLYNTRQCFGFTTSTPSLLAALSAATDHTEES